MSALTELWTYSQLMCSTPNQRNVVGTSAMNSLLDVLMVHAPKMPVFRGNYRPFKLMIVVAPPHFGITTLVKSYCREQTVTMFYLEINSSCVNDNKDTLKRCFDNMELHLNARDKTSESSAPPLKFILYMKDPLYSFYNQSDISEMFISRFNKLREQCERSDSWCVVMRSTVYPTVDRGKCNYELFRLIDVSVPYECPSYEERVQLIKQSCKKYLHNAELPEALVKRIAEDTAGIGLGQLDYAISGCCSRKAFTVAWHQPALVDSKDTTSFIPDEDAFINMLDEISIHRINPDFYHQHVHPDIRIKLQNQDQAYKLGPPQWAE